MFKLRYACCLILLLAAGIALARDPSSSAAPGLRGVSSEKTKDSEIVRVITISGFDPNGEPEIRVLENGSILVVFNFMPPSYVEDGEDLGSFSDFDEQLAEASGVNVAWEDREVFLIENPEENTVATLKTFLESYPKP